MFDNKVILVTGGTGSFGKEFIRFVIKNYKFKKIIIFSRDELKQHEFRISLSDKELKKVRFFIGDIRDKNRLKMAMQDVNILVHAAALKQVPTIEYNPFEAVKTNIYGAQNIIEASLETKVEKVIALSTDKASSPINVYGATKLVSDKLFIAGNNIKGNRDLSFSCVRYGNVMGSRGSVIPLFLEKSKTGNLTITDPNMTRFNITLEQATKMVLWVLENSYGGEIFVPKIPSYQITDLAEAIGPSCKKIIIGVRSGEKIHEEMITAADSYNTFDLGDYYAIIHPSNEVKRNQYKNHFHSLNLKFDQMKIGLSYNSKENKPYLTVQQIRDLIKTNISSNFNPI